MRGGSWRPYGLGKRVPGLPASGRESLDLKPGLRKSLPGPWKVSLQPKWGHLSIVTSNAK